ncbi:MAG TPA: hypothetical protein VM223_01435 [Planctomycetota bacterium]|nr:hypothetical protein [Planctomycetota bacterium]
MRPPSVDPLPACFDYERSEGSEWCEFCRSETPLLERQCKIAHHARLNEHRDLSLCQDFGHFDAKRYHCVMCWRSRSGHSKLECKDLTARRAGEAQAVRQETQVDQAKVQLEAGQRRTRLAAIREALPAEVQAELREAAERSLNGFMAAKFAREKRNGELMLTTRLAIEAELDRITEERFSTA